MCAVRVICLRHGEPVDAGTLRNDPPAGPLSDAGRAQAGAAAEALRGERVAHVYTSDLTRAIETGHVVGGALGVSASVLPGLAEFRVGVIEGTRDPVTRARASAVLRRWLLDGELEARIEGGESGREVLDRFAEALATIADAHRGETVVAVGHVGTFTIGLASLCAGLTPAGVWGRPLGYCAPVELSYDGAGWRCLGWPGTATG